MTTASRGAIGRALTKRQSGEGLAVDVAVGDVNDYGFVKTAEAIDPAGNTILFVQEVQPG